MRIASFLSLLYFSLSCAWITILLRSGFPQNNIVQGPDISSVSLVISIILLLSAFFTIYLGKRVNPPPLKNPTFIRWILFFLGVLILFVGFVVFSVSIYSPYLFGSEHSVPEIGVVSWLVMSLILAIVLFLASKMNSAQRPNLMRYLALILVIITTSLTTVQALILIYAMPVNPPAVFSFLSGLLTLAFIPFSLLILIISRSYVAVRGGNQ